MPSSVDLGKRLEKTVSELVKVGRYNSRSEVLREGVRLVQEREARLAIVDAAITRGVADADAGRVTDAVAAFDKLTTRYQPATKAQLKRPARKHRQP